MTSIKSSPTAKTKKPCFEEGDLHDLIERMILLMSPQTHAKRVRVVRNFDQSIGQITMDAEKMKQVILNILSNAVESAPEAGKIEISTRNGRESESPRTIRIEIRDNGAGIPEPILDKIFEPYFTTKHQSRLHSGTGLGLFIAHQSMQDQGGTIDVVSNVNRGSCFILTLPVVPPGHLIPMEQEEKRDDQED